jgi:AcrR family transcriptional regulator
VPTTAPRPPGTQPAPQGLRGRKKARTRLAIQDAALVLFVEKGFEATTVDEIAERAEVSKATFFRYFATKGEVIFSEEGYGQEELRSAIVDRPAEEAPLIAVSRAIRVEWLPALDPQRFARQTRAAATSPVLRGLSADLAVRWQQGVAAALAERAGIDAPDARCRLVASLVFTALSSAVNAWVHGDGTSDLGRELDTAFLLLADVCREIGAEPRASGPARPSH